MNFIVDYAQERTYENITVEVLGPRWVLLEDRQDGLVARVNLKHLDKVIEELQWIKEAYKKTG